MYSLIHTGNALARHFKTTAAILLLFPLALFSQTEKIDWDWQRDFSSHGAAAFQTAIEATNGFIISVGATDSKTQGGTDGLLRIMDAGTGQVRIEKQFGGKRDDAFYGVAQTWNGQFLLAGTTASDTKGGTDAWIVIVNDRGEKVKELRFGTTGNDACQWVLTLPDGAAILAGYKEDHKSGDLWFAKMEADTLAWEATVGKEEFASIVGLVRAKDGGIVFSGNTLKKAASGSGTAYAAKIDAKGKLGWKYFFGDKGWNEASALIATQDGGFAIAGLTRPKNATETACWLLKINREGSRQWERIYTDKGASLAQSLMENESGFLLAGASKSYRSGARSSKPYLLQTSSGGELSWNKFIETERDNDAAFSNLLTLHDGALVVLQKIENKATLNRMARSGAQDNTLAGIRDAGSVQIADVKMRTADGTLKPNEQSALSFLMTNTSDIDLPNVRVVADKRSDNEHLEAWSTNYLGTLRKGESMMVNIPVSGKASLTDGTCDLSLTITSGEKKLNTIDKTITLHELRPATLGINDYKFLTSSTSNAVTLKVQISNSGDEGSGAVEVRFSAPAGIEASGEKSKLLGVVGAHKSREVSFSFTKSAGFKGDVARIGCTVIENGTTKANKSFDWQAGGKTIANGPILIWTDPAPHETGSHKVRATDNQFEFKMTVVSPAPLDTKNFKLVNNGVEMEGSKFNEQELSAPQMDNARYTYTYKNKIPLAMGETRLQVLVNGELSDALEISFAPERANLHVLTIGPSHEDLKFTRKDAMDMAAAFRNQGGEGKLFNKVFVHEYTTPEKTSETGIKQAFYDMGYLWRDKQISQNDVLLIFISSHGKISNNRFKILQTGYDPKYENIAIDFKDNVLEVLAPLNCKKLIFLDACHSGGAKDGYGALSAALVDLVKAQPGVSTLSSSSSTEKSYEDASWGNGAFTKAILDAFGGVEVRDANGTFRADGDGDNVLRLGELYSFLRRRVPELVKQTIPNAPTTQTPFMPENQLDANLPIYLIEKR